MKFNLVILIALSMGCASSGTDKLEASLLILLAQKEIGPIEEPEPVGYPDFHHTLYIDDNTL